MLGRTSKSERAVAVAAGDVKLAVCSGTAWAAVVKNKLRIAWAGNVGLAVAHETYPLPGGNVAAVGVSGPSIVMENGDCLFWQNGGWQLVANILAREEA